jgi:signal transduction histidine kinase
MLSTTSPLPMAQASLDGLLQALLDASDTGLVHLGPVYAAAVPEEVVDFTYERLNSAAQRLLGLPEHPRTSYRALAPDDAAGLAFLRETFLSGPAEPHTLAARPAAGQPSPLRVAAQRVGPMLVASLTRVASSTATTAPGLATPPHLLVAEWPALLAQAPVAIAVLRGPQHLVELASPAMYALWNTTREQMAGQPLLAALPKAVSEELGQLLRAVPVISAPYLTKGLPSKLGQPEGQPLGYLDFVYQPLHNTAGQHTGAVVVLTDVSEQVRGRLCTQHLNEELRRVNEELHTANEELRAKNQALADTQQQLQRLNQELECRVGRGIREAQAAEAEAERQRRQLARFFQQAPAAICVLDGPDLVYELVNPSYQQFFPGRALVGRPLREAAPELLAQPTYEWLRRVYETGTSHEGHEVRLLVTSTGEESPQEHYFNCLYQPRHDEQGRVDGVLAFALDVTDQVYAQQRVEALQAEAAAAAERRAQERETSYQVFEQTPAAVALMWGPQHRFEYANPAFGQLFPGRELRHHTLAEAVPEAQDQGLATLLDNVYHTGETFVGTEIKFTTLLPDGKPLRTAFYNLTYQAYREHDRILGVLVFCYEVTEQVGARLAMQESAQQALNLAQDLRATNEQLRRTNVDLDNFIYTASHDLKAPIANIEGLLLLLREQLPTEARQAGLVPKVLGMMQGSIERFQLTIAQLTDLAKLQQAHTQPAEEVDLPALFEAVRLDLVPLLEEARAELLVNLDSCTTISFAPQHLRSIIYNLLTNAIKYRSATRPLVIALRCHAQPGATVLEVRDNGLGLTAEQQSKLFGMFRRLHDHVPGSGMGLYMVKRIVENAGGTIVVNSQPNEGSTFIVSLPD